MGDEQIVVQLRLQEVQCREPLVLTTQLTFPDRDSVPALTVQQSDVTGVAGTVTGYFGGPEVRVCFRQPKVRAVGMPVPEAAIDEDGSAVARQHQVRTAGEFLVVEAEAEAIAPEILTDDDFRACVFGADGSHVVMALKRDGHGKLKFISFQINSNFFAIFVRIIFSQITQFF